MDDVFQLEVGGVRTVVEHSGALVLNDLSDRLRSFEPGETTGRAFKLRIAVTDEPGSGPYRGFSFNGKHRVTFDQPGLRGRIDLVGKTALVECASEEPDPKLDYFLRVLYSLLIFESGGLLVHGAGIVRHGSGYVFLGPSGAGKTTVSSLSPDVVVLNDDLVVLRPDVGGWTIWSTPFSGPGQMRPNPGRAPLGVMVRLAQAQNHGLEALPPAFALAELAASCPVIPADQSRGKVLLERLRSLLERHPLYRLHFSKDSGFWAVVDGELGGSGGLGSLT